MIRTSFSSKLCTKAQNITYIILKPIYSSFYSEFKIFFKLKLIIIIFNKNLKIVTHFSNSAQIDKTLYTCIFICIIDLVSHYDL